MNSLDILRDNLAAVSSYGLLSLGVLVIGFLALEIVTPGSLRNLVWVQHRRSAIVLTVAALVGIGLVLLAGAHASAPLVLWRGIVYTAVYAAAAIALMMLSFFIVDWLTPGKLGSLILDDENSAAGWVSAAVFVVIGAVMASAIV